MRNLLLTGCLVALAACHSHDSSSSTGDSTQVDSTANATIADTTEVIMRPESETIIPESISDEVFILPGTSVFTDTTLTIPIETDDTQLRKGTCILRTQRFYPEEAEYCDRHPNLQVQLEDGGTAWVPGEGALVSGQSSYSDLGSVNFRGQTYSFKKMFDTGVGPSDSDGLTGCESYEVICLVNQQGKEEFLGALEGSARMGVTSNYHGYFCLISSDGVSSSVSNIEADENEIRIMLAISYQDGGDTAIIHIGKGDDGFVAETIELETRD